MKKGHGLDFPWWFIAAMPFLMLWEWWKDKFKDKKGDPHDISGEPEK